MKILRAISIGIIIWLIGVSIYSLSFYITLLEDAEQQANVLLFIMVIPLLWFGAKQYYKRDKHTSGHWVGLTFFLTSASLDALVTVPLLIAPYGGSHYSFFTDPVFYLIGLEFIIIVILYKDVKNVNNHQSA